jgi:fructose-1,6-bisphosphatase/inositol monophosphatase family enzyme
MEKATPQQIIQTNANKIRDLTVKGMKKEKLNLNKDKTVTTTFDKECERLVIEMIRKYENEMLKEIKDITIDPKNYYILVQNAFAD